MYRLYIANKNYSSWSLRPWVLMRELGVDFEEQLLVFGDAPAWRHFRTFCPSGRVPCLLDAQNRIWDSISIVEFLAERHPAVWPLAAEARAWARSAAAEMHSSFNALREQCSMSCGVRARLRERPAALESDLGRLAALWSEGLQRFGGPFLAGERFTAVDAFFCPVAFRLQTYGLALGGGCDGYAGRLRALPAMQLWYAEALREPARDPAHEQQLTGYAELLQDLREG
jgi:glutathione S-transferase